MMTVMIEIGYRWMIVIMGMINWCWKRECRVILGIGMVIMNVIWMLKLVIIVIILVIIIISSNIKLKSNKNTKKIYINHKTS